MAINNKTSVGIGEIVDYYAIYNLDINADSKVIVKRLRQLQGELCSKLSGGSLNSPEILKKLEEGKNLISDAIKIFKKDERREEYDQMLEAAYRAGKINVEDQKMAQDLYEELEALFMKGIYNAVINRCMEALNNNVRDHRLYVLMARSYYELHDIDRSLGSVEEGLKVHVDNMPLLRVGARFANEGKQDYEKAQMYVNRMTQIDEDNALAVSEQSYLYVCMGKEDLGYKTIDQYMEKHPNDLEFRKTVAYDLVGHSYRNYTKDPGSDAYVIASEEDYNKCLEKCNKAVSVYSDENTRNALETAKSYGEVEYNDENREAIIWSFIGGGLFGFFAIVGFLFSIVNFSISVLPAMLLSIVITGGIGTWMLICGIKLNKLSYRPYWQINKFILTGKREPEEEKYILLGNLIVSMWKISIGIAKGIFRLIISFI